MCSYAGMVRNSLKSFESAAPSNLTSLVVAAFREEVGTYRALDLFHFLALDVPHELGGHARSVGKRDAVMDPLPDLRRPGAREIGVEVGCSIVGDPRLLGFIELRNAGPRPQGYGC